MRHLVVPSLLLLLATAANAQEAAAADYESDCPVISRAPRLRVM